MRPGEDSPPASMDGLTLVVRLAIRIVLLFMTSPSHHDLPGFSALPRKALPGAARAVRGGMPDILKSLAAVALLLTASACSTRSELGFATLMREVPPTQAAILPPPGGPSVVAVLQRTYQNGISQEIALSTASATTGQNAFYVSLRNDPVTRSEIEDVLTIRPITQEMVQAEMEERLPGINMQTSLIYVQNKYGPFGFATGRSAAGDLCLYAWQQIEPNEPAVLAEGGIISMRLRLCDADATTEQLLRIMYGYTISAFFSSGNWNPYGSPPPPPAHLGQIDAPIYPPIASTARPATVVRQRVLRVEETPVVRPVPGRVIDKDTVPAPISAPVPAGPSEPLENYPVVPPPPAGQ
jgi:hypothetical protein